MAKEKQQTIENQKHKDTVFRLLYREKKKLLELYNALNGTDYTNEEELIVTTLEGETFLGMKNDVSYIFNDELNLYEHQSTPCPNIPLRDLSYVTSIYREQVDINKTYKSTPIKIPTPRFVVFYNGTIPMEDEKVYKLSDMFEKSTAEPELELKVRVYNINQGHNEKLLETCRTLKDYSIFVAKVRKYIVEAKTRHDKDDEEFFCLAEDDRKTITAEAVGEAIDWCIANDVLKEFFLKYREEAIAVGIIEYSAERHMQVIKDEGYDLGHEDGHTQGLDEGIRGTVAILREMGLDDEAIVKKICKQYNLTPEKARKYL